MFRQIIASRWSLIGSCFAVALALAAGGYRLYRSDVNDIKARQHGELSTIAQFKASEIAAWRSERLSDAQMISSGSVQARVARWLQEPEDGEAKADLQLRLQTICHTYGYANAIVAAPDGRLLLSLDPKLTELEADARRLTAAAVAAKPRAVFGELARCLPCEQIHLDVGAPVIGDDGRPVAVLMLRSDAEDYLYPLVRSWPVPSRTAETYLVRRDGDSALFLNDLRHVPGAGLSRRVPLTKTHLAAVQAVLDKTGRFEGDDYRGVAVLADVRPIPDSPWFMVAKVDADELLAEAWYRGAAISIVVALCILMTAVLAALAGSRRRQGLYRALARVERERRKALEEVRAALYGIGDGVIVTDADGCVTRLNPEAERLTGWEEPEAIGRPLDEVFRIASEETGEPIGSIARQVLETGRVMGLAQRAALVSRDGTRRPIADSHAPIHDDDGQATGMVVVFRDITGQRRAEARTNELSARNAAILLAVPEIIMEVNADKVYTWANPAGVRFFGPDVVGRQASDYFEGEQDTYAAVQPVFEGSSEVVYVESWQRRRDGKKRLLAWWCRGLIDAHGKVNGALSTARDITESRWAEESLKESEQRFRAIFQQAAVGVAQVEVRTGRFIRVNRRFCEIVGRTERELTATTFMAISHPDDVEADLVRTRRLVDGLVRSFAMEKRYLRPDGAEVWANITKSAMWTPGEQAAWYVLVAEDITSRKRVEANNALMIGTLQILSRASDLSGVIGDILGLIRRSTGFEAAAIRLRQGDDFPYFVHDGLSDGFVEKENSLCARDADGHVVRDDEGNPVLECLCGTVLSGRTDPARACFTEGGSFWTNSVTRLRSSGDAPGPEAMMRLRCGNAGYESVALIPLRSDEQIIGLLQLNDRRAGRLSPERVHFLEALAASIGIAVQRRQSAEQLQQAQKMEAVGQLAGGIAHDFRNQLTVIRGYAEMLLRHGLVAADARSFVDEIVKASDRSTSLSSRLLAFSRKQMLQPRIVNLNDVIGDLARSLTRVIGEDIRITIQASGDLENVRLDPSQFQQALLNLVVNARDAMPQGGRLRIETANVELDAAFVRAHKGAAAGPFVRVQVSDTGHGMDRQTLARAFEPFFTTKATGQGTGLGLAMVYGFVKQSGGYVTAESQPSRGAAFRLYFPRVTADAPGEAAAPADATGLPRGRGTVLVVEDESPIREMIVRTLGECGYHVLEASGAKAALTIAHCQPPPKIDLLLTDVVMRGMDGPTLAESLQADNPDLGVLFMSGYADSALILHGITGEDGALLVKPFSADGLVRAVARSMGAVVAGGGASSHAPSG